MNSMERNIGSRLFGVFIFCVLFIPIISSAQDSGITINLRRNVGTDMGDGRRIRGEWTLSGSGPEGTVKIEILFNETVVYTVQSKEFSFRFNTEEYWIGEVNITVRAYLSDSEFVSRSLIREFIDDSFDNMIWTITAGIFAILIIIAAVGYKKSKANSKKEVKIDDVKIDGA